MILSFINYYKILVIKYCVAMGLILFISMILFLFFIIGISLDLLSPMGILLFFIISLIICCQNYISIYDIFWNIWSCIRSNAAALFFFKLLIAYSICDSLKLGKLSFMSNLIL